MNHYKSILVTVDGSKEAEYAFRKSIDIAKRNVGSLLNIVNGIDTRSFEAIWENEIQLTQTLSLVYEQEASSRLNRIEVKFNHKINEKHMGDIEDFLESILVTLDVLNGI